jgi:DGQHR domain-containing protein
MIPNALVVAFDDKVKFEPTRGGKRSKLSRHGTLIIPTPDVDDESKVGWIVDGQQRLAAIREADIDEFPVCVVAFIATDDVEQREQFILVNATKPLPKGLIYELLPTTEGKLPSLLQRRRFPAHLLNRLNREESSPFKELIRTPTNGDGVIKDNSILKMIENSLSDGVLYRFRGSGEDAADADAMIALMSRYWSAVASVFGNAWGLTPKRSRLMHGAGIVSMGFIMDAISDRHRGGDFPSQEQFEEDLRPIHGICRWTDGYWDFGPGNQRKWNEIQNTSKDIQMLANYLLIQYKANVWNRSAAPAA